MSILKRIQQVNNEHPDNIAIVSGDETLTYGDLWRKSDILASWLAINKQTNTPVVCYGHKSPLMLVAFLACVKSGRAYCPVDYSMPMDRIVDILETVDNDFLLSTMPIEVEGYENFDVSSILNDIESDYKPVSDEQWVKEEELFYMIFTSGSTGKPKGVEITAKNLENFAKWSSELAGPASEKLGAMFVDQAPWSFDLSVMDTYSSLICGGTLLTLNKDLQNNMGELFDYLKKNPVQYWISTPSFVDMCLADKSFDSNLLPNMKAFWFCGERLTNKTAKTLKERFGQVGAKVINTYGPTETTVAVTSVEITEDVIANNPLLPVGKPKEGTRLLIIKDGKEVPNGEQGEIVILGDTVGNGYYKEPEKTAKAFKLLNIDGKKEKAYFTGDEGYLKGDWLYCIGRLDFQIKLHGYRIELGDIEEKLLQNPKITSAVVIPKWEEEKIKHLVAFVVKEDYEGSFAERKTIKEEVGKLLPSYMVPKTIKVLEQLPKTNNGKVDRKKLAEEI